MLNDLLFFILKVLLGGLTGLLFMGIMRKFAARMQQRVGPPIWQPFLDVIKLFSKENMSSKRETPYISIGPVISLAAYISILIIIPLSGFPSIEPASSVIYIIYLFLMGVSGYVIAGFSSRNPYGGLGGSREIVQAFGFEIPFIIALLVPTFSTLMITESYFFIHPMAFLAFMIAVQGELELPPFHTPHAEQEIVGGVMTELSGYKLGLFEIAYAFKLFVLSLIVSIVFLGGGSFWFIMGKSFLVLCLLTLIRMLFARMTIYQVTKFFLLVATPIALVDFIKILLIP